MSSLKILSKDFEFSPDLTISNNKQLIYVKYSITEGDVK